MPPNDYGPGAGASGPPKLPPSNAQREQRNNADPDHQDGKGYRIIIEPMPALHTHDASPYPQLPCAPLLPTVTGRGGLSVT
jgi:hypothetical protein